MHHSTASPSSTSPACCPARTARCCSPTWARASSRSSSPASGDDTRAWGPPFVGGESALLPERQPQQGEPGARPQDAGGARACSTRCSTRADVLVENFRPGAMARLGLGYERVAATHPRLIYCSISGFGQTGPRRDEPGYDAVVQAEGGLMSITGDAGRTAVPARRRHLRHRRRHVRGAGDRAGAARARAHRPRAAGRHRHARRDRGAADLSGRRSTSRPGSTPQRMGNRHPTIVPYETFAASDGDFVARGRQRRAVAAVLPGASSSTRSRTTSASRPTGSGSRTTTSCGRCSRRNCDAAARRVGRPAAGRPACRAASVRDVGEVLQDPQIEAREMVQERRTCGGGRAEGDWRPDQAVGDAGQRADAAADARRSTPTRILSELAGLPADEIDRLRADGAVAGQA